MNDKRLYPNTVIFKGTDDNETTYINERVLEQIRAEIWDDIGGSGSDYTDGYNDGLYYAIDVIDKYKGDKA